MDYKPKFPYNEDQIILNSNRVSINSKKDSIFLFADKAIGLSSNEGIHFNTDKNIIINGNKIQIGLNAKEPLVKGNQLINFLQRLIDLLNNVGEQLSESLDSNGNPIPTVQTSGADLINSSKRLQKLLKTLNSENNFTT